MQQRTFARSALGIAAFHLTAVAATCHSPQPASADRGTNVAFTTSAGTVVHLRDIVVFVGPRGRSLTLYIQTPTPAAQHVQAQQEAQELVRAIAMRPERGPFERASVAVCRTQACLEMRERPEEMFLFAHQADGTWGPDAP